VKDGSGRRQSGQVNPQLETEGGKTDGSWTMGSITKPASCVACGIDEKKDTENIGVDWREKQGTRKRVRWKNSTYR
jgi:hypothetical protein